MVFAPVLQGLDELPEGRGAGWALERQQDVKEGTVMPGGPAVGDTAPVLPPRGRGSNCCHKSHTPSSDGSPASRRGLRDLWMQRSWLQSDDGGNFVAFRGRSLTVGTWVATRGRGACWQSRRRFGGVSAMCCRPVPGRVSKLRCPPVRLSRQQGPINLDDRDTDTTGAQNTRNLNQRSINISMKGRES